jgi:hypothetical protein
MRQLRDLAGRLVAGERVFEVAGVMTLVMTLLHLVSTPQLREVILIVAAAGLIDRRLLTRADYWFVLTGLFVLNHVLLWHVLDNHKWLLTYWCLALGVSRLQTDARAALSRNARWLVGLCFLFATLSKLLSPEYLDGTFFQFTLLTDRRFSGFADVVGGVSPEVTGANISALRELARAYGDSEVVQLRDGPRIASLALVLSYWTIAIEGAIAVLFLLPARFSAGVVRDAALILFMLSTYPVATVVGYGRLLAILGLAQTPNRLGLERALYLACFLLLPFYRFPFARIIRLVTG